MNNVLGGQYSLVNNVRGGHYSPVNNVRGDISGGNTVHYDTVTEEGSPYFTAQTQVGIHDAKTRHGR